LNEYQNDAEETNRINKELPFFNIEIKPIKFRHSKGEYFFDKASNTIYKGVGSIKFCNNEIGESLYNLKDKKYTNFINLLIDLTENTPLNTRQIEILIKANYFDEFGLNKKLFNIFNQFTNGDNKYKKTYVDKTKQKRIISLYEYETKIEDEKLSIKEQLAFEKDILGYAQSTYDLPKVYTYILDIDTTYSPKLNCYCLANGKTEIMKIDKKTFNKNKVKAGDIVKLLKSVPKPKSKKVGDDWVPIPNTKEWWIQNYQIVDL
jgi:DNA polymerase-3 subunit alpha